MKNTFLINCYFKHTRIKKLGTILIKALVEIENYFHDPSIIIGGDFNQDLRVWENDNLSNQLITRGFHIHSNCEGFTREQQYTNSKGD